MADRDYYLAVVRPENLQKLRGFGLTFYAVKRGTRIKSGDRIVLYRSRGAAKQGGPGIVGAFEVTGDPHPARSLETSSDFFLRLYPTQIPWRPIAGSIDNPLPIAPLVPSLKMFPNKSKYGSVLQTTLKKMPREDYEVIEAALIAHQRQSP